MHPVNCSIVSAFTQPNDSLRRSRRRTLKKTHTLPPSTPPKTRANRRQWAYPSNRCQGLGSPAPVPSKSETPRYAPPTCSSTRVSGCPVCPWFPTSLAVGIRGSHSPSRWKTNLVVEVQLEGVPPEDPAHHDPVYREDKLLAEAGDVHVVPNIVVQQAAASHLRHHALTACPREKGESFDADCTAALRRCRFFFFM